MSVFDDIEAGIREAIEYEHGNLVTNTKKLSAVHLDNPTTPCERSRQSIVSMKGEKPMEKYIPYEKLSKKKQREINAQKRGTWGGINPVTRKPKNSKAYDRNKAGQWKRESHDLPCFCFP